MARSSEIVVAAGVESMSRVPMGSSIGTATDLDGEAFSLRYPEGLVSQGVAAELIADRWGLSRTELDEFAVRSQTNAASARDAGRFRSEITPIAAPGTDGATAEVTDDEGIRASTVETLSRLKPAFEDAATSARFPQINWSTTAANSSQLTDGAAAVLLMSSDRARALGLTARARIHTMAVEGDDPLYMLTAIIPVTQKVLARAGMTHGDIDLIEVNEAFASVVLAWAKELEVNLDKVNVNGGSIALGHPLGASGTRITTTLLHALEDRGGRWGLQLMCEAGGLANALIIERLDP